MAAVTICSDFGAQKSLGGGQLEATVRTGLQYLSLHKQIIAQLIPENNIVLLSFKILCVYGLQ